MTSVAIFRFLIAALLFGVCSLLTSVAINSAGANTHYYRSQNSLAAPAGKLPSASQISDAHLYISQAKERMPNDADILDLKGRVDYFRAIYEQDPIAKGELLSLSKQAHLTALAQRPFWPYSEVNILYTSSAAGEIDNEFMERFSRARALGPDDKFVIRDLARLGIKNWNDLSARAKSETITLTEQVLKRRLLSNRELKSFMYNHGQFHRVCAQLRQFEEKRALCNSQT